MTELQEAILKIAKEVHKICIENDIPYFMLGGTFIGAIRHKGFIPWDDDLDIGLTYDNYLRLQKVLKGMNHPWLVTESAMLGDDCPHLFTKVYDKNTTFLHTGSKGPVKGVFVDIFPVVYAGNTKEHARIEMKCAFFWRKILEQKYCNPYADRPLLKYSTKLLSMLFPKSFVINKCKKQYDRLSSTPTKYFSALDGTKKDVYDKYYFNEDVVLYHFEDTQLYGIKDYDNFLTDVFKNYMQLPPEDKRVGHHVVDYDLHIPYEQYNKEHGYK